MRAYLFIAGLVYFFVSTAQSIKERSLLKDEYDQLEDIYKKQDFELFDQQARAFLSKSLKARDGYAIIKAHRLIGGAFHVRGRFDSAIVNYLKSISYIERIPEEDFIRTSDYYFELDHNYENCAKIFTYFMAYELAEEYFEKALNITQKYDYYKRTVLCKRSLAGLYDEMGRHEDAIRLTQSVLTDLDTESYLYPRVLNRLAISYYFNRAYDSSIFALRKRLTKLSAKDSLGHSITFHNIALSFTATKYYDSAELYYEKSLMLLSDDLKDEFVNTAVDYALLKIKKREFYAAKKILLEAESLVKEMEPGLKHEEWYFELYGHLVTASEALGDDQGVMVYRKKYENELKAYTKLHRRYDMEGIVQDHYEELEKQKREASLKLYGSFISGSFLLILTLTFSVNRYQKIKAKKKLQKKTTDHKLSELKALKAQINPHFLFNALNSIQSFILEDKNNVAEEYLVKYGKLMRKILDHSNELMVTLNDELEALQLYVELEQLRVKQGFEFGVMIDENIDPHTTQVPSMFIQPFIENAIWHGVSKLEGRGKITLEFLQNDDSITVIVKDNGVGFDTDLTPKSSENPKGVQLVRDRIELLNGSDRLESSLEILSGIGEGTKVRICYLMN